EQFAKLPKISIDFGVMEKAADVLVVEMKCQWLDLGSWSAIAQTGLPDADENISIAVNGLSVKGRRNVLVAEDDHAIITLGVSDIVVVHAGDATLVCHRDHEQAIKDLARLRQQRFGDRLE
ncbi:MAG: mannose-1-phosphate guanyltransferase, partial [Phycisphaerae bacterium]|nr:mannose-1-phosphate guanyltransferase [Phycisphaerae bacterium]